ncbi:MAG: hypothetical protein QGG64_15035 [Candidatus Latescibacteria bacterium]|jgi:hypothetical protein|nr:hypothetical protein [Candidatus Latescibacterota bacterium]
MTARSWLIFAVMMVGLVGMFIVYGITRDPRATSSVKPEIVLSKGDTVRVAVETLLDRYEKDAGKADRAFKHRICEASGFVVDVAVNWLNEPVVKMSGDRVSRKTVSFIFLASQADWVSQFSKGDAMTVRGICQGKDRRLGIRFKKCEIAVSSTGKGR